MADRDRIIRELRSRGWERSVGRPNTWVGSRNVRMITGRKYLKNSGGLLSVGFFLRYEWIKGEDMLDELLGKRTEKQ
jgi:hypothetical protein